MLETMKWGEAHPMGIRGIYAGIGSFLRQNAFWCLVGVLMFIELMVYCWLNVPADDHYGKYVAEVKPQYSGTFWFILFENLKAMLLMTASGLVPLGLGTLWLGYWSVGSLTATFKYLLPDVGWGRLLVCLAPHGVFEMTALALSFTLGLLLSRHTTVFLLTLFRGRRALRAYGCAWMGLGRCVVFLLVPLVLLAAVVEVGLSGPLTDLLMGRY